MFIAFFFFIILAINRAFHCTGINQISFLKGKYCKWNTLQLGFMDTVYAFKNSTLEHFCLTKWCYREIRNFAACNKR